MVGVPDGFQIGAFPM